LYFTSTLHGNKCLLHAFLSNDQKIILCKLYCYFYTFRWINRNKSPLQWLLGMGVWAHLVVNVFLSVFLLMVARVNYPGGEAIIKLHQVLPAGSPVHVHIGNLAAQTGVSRFTEFNPNWRYFFKKTLSSETI